MYFGSTVVTGPYSQYNRVPLADTNSRGAWGTWRTPTLLPGTTMPPCSWICIDITGFCLGLSHQDTYGYQSSSVISGFCQVAADPASPPRSLGGLPQAQHSVWWVFNSRYRARAGWVLQGVSRAFQGCLMPLAAPSLDRAVIVFSSTKRDLSCIPCHLLCHRWYKLLSLHHETPIWSHTVQLGHKEQWQ